MVDCVLVNSLCFFDLFPLLGANQKLQICDGRLESLAYAYRAKVFEPFFVRGGPESVLHNIFL